MISARGQSRMLAAAYEAVRSFTYPSGTKVRCRRAEGRTAGGAFVAQGVAVVLLEGGGPAVPLSEIEVDRESLPAPTWVLVETFASKQRGRPVYFRTYTSIGPAATEDLAEAHRFDSREAAVASRAYSHVLSFYEPLELESFPEGGGAPK